jgi:hypothetical protein
MPYQDCDPRAVRHQDLPPNWSTTQAHICGFSYPISEKGPLPDISACCTGPLKIINECFHYCPAALDVNTFGACVHLEARMAEAGVAFGSTCNFATPNERGGVSAPTNWTSLLRNEDVQVWGVLSAFVLCLYLFRARLREEPLI